MVVTGGIQYGIVLASIVLSGFLSGALIASSRGIDEYDTIDETSLSWNLSKVKYSQNEIDSLFNITSNTGNIITKNYDREDEWVGRRNSSSSSSSNNNNIFNPTGKNFTILHKEDYHDNEIIEHERRSRRKRRQVSFTQRWAWLKAHGHVWDKVVLVPKVAYDSGRYNSKQHHSRVGHKLLTRMQDIGQLIKSFEDESLEEVTRDNNYINTGPNVLVAFVPNCQWDQTNLISFESVIDFIMDLAVKYRGNPYETWDPKTLRDTIEAGYLQLTDDLPIWTANAVWFHARSQRDHWFRFLLTTILVSLKYDTYYFDRILQQFLGRLHIGMFGTSNQRMADGTMSLFASLPCVRAVGEDLAMWRSTTVPVHTNNNSLFGPPPALSMRLGRDRMWYNSKYGMNLQSVLHTLPNDFKRDVVVTVIDSGFFKESYLFGRYCLSKTECILANRSCRLAKRPLDCDRVTKCKNKNFFNPDASVFEEDDGLGEGHGLVVSSLITTWLHSTAPLAPCWPCMIQAYQVARGDNYAHMSTVLFALNAAPEHSRVSFLAYLWPRMCPIDSNLPYSVWTAALKALEDENHLVVMPAGDRKSDLSNPVFQTVGGHCKDRSSLNLKSVLLIGGTTRNMGPIPWSNYGPMVFMSAPGERIITMRPSSEHYRTVCPIQQLLPMEAVTGTSFAAALVTAVIGQVLFETNLKMPSVTIIELLRRSSRLSSRLKGLSSTGAILDMACAIRMARYWMEQNEFPTQEFCEINERQTIITLNSPKVSRYRELPFFARHLDSLNVSSTPYKLS